MAFLSLILHNDTIYTCTFDVIIFSHKTTFLVKIFMMMIIMTMMGMYRNYRACTPTLTRATNQPPSSSRPSSFTFFYNDNNFKREKNTGKNNIFFFSTKKKHKKHFFSTHVLFSIHVRYHSSTKNQPQKLTIINTHLLYLVNLYHYRKNRNHIAP